RQAEESGSAAWSLLSVRIGASRENPVSVRHFHGTRAASPRTIFGEPPFDHDLIPGFDRILAPPIAREPVRSPTLALPFRHRAAGIFDVQIQPNMRIRPFEFCQRTFQLDGLVPIEFSRKRMMPPN